MVDNTIIQWYYRSMADGMTVTNVRLPRQELLGYRQAALAMGKSFSQLVREALARMVQPVEVVVTRTARYQTFEEIEKIAVVSGPRNGARKHDEYLY